METKDKPATSSSGFHVAPGKYCDSIIKAGFQYVKRRDGRIVGKVIDGVLVKNVDARKHQLRSPPAWACDVDVLRQAAKYGATEILLKDKSAKLTWETGLDSFWGSESIEVDRGYGIQRALPLSNWNVHDERYPHQLSLFGKAV